MKRFLVIVLFFFVTWTNFGKGDIMHAAEKPLADGLYARMTTSRGEIVLALEFEKTPLTVANFVGLAEGTKNSSRGPNPYYDGLTFHRVIADFMVQGGCPQGTGTGGPGYTFPDEIDPTLKHSSPGILSMANAGPGTNGSQFFITHVATPWLDGKHTVFGHVVSGQDVVDAIRKGDRLEKVEILRVGEKAEAFKADQAAFDVLLNETGGKELARERAEEAAQKKLIEEKWPNAVTTRSGLKYVVVAEGEGATPKPGSTISAHYTGTLLNGKKFDSSVDRGEPISFPVGMGRVIPGWDEALVTMKKGEKRVLIIPPQLAYGPRGVPGAIPPNATLVFEVEMVDF